MTTGWRALAHDLAASLLPGGGLDLEWRTAFADTPRHLFVHTFYDTLRGEWVTQTGEQHLRDIYTNIDMITQMRYTAPDGQGAQRATSSSSMPDIMAWMLQNTYLTSGHKVLEIGTGTGYNTAILCHRLGAENVTSIDIDPDLVDTARVALAKLDLHATLVAGNGEDGFPDLAPFDAILATAATDHIPPAWIHQLAPQGRIVTDLRGSFSGAMTTLQRTAADTVSGRCHTFDAAFMPLRADLAFPLRHGSAQPFVIDRRNPAVSTTGLDPDVVARHPVLRFAVELQLGAVRADLFSTDDELVITADDDSWATVTRAPDSHGRRAVHQSGPRRVWDSAAAAIAIWEHAHRPTLDAFGVTATDDIRDQRVWLHTPDTPQSWPLPI